ncbi:hypothetical protein [Nocardia sp. NBC_01009]|uniref:hypothetical protein n=1 Tax=Nocardia sp. NBC_01009 TaxID=2975996 RepID=UPI00386EBC34|nr:hypothetical protein OHA42_04880 [Nocardia sp. NBC_01009]
MKFEHIDKTGGFMTDFEIGPSRVALWTAAFAVESLAELHWDMTPVSQAIPLIDAAIARFNETPDAFRALVSVDDPVGLRGNRGALLHIRKWITKNEGTISFVEDA